MFKSRLNVPKGIRFVSEWSDLEGGYRLENYSFPHILDKQITGCGFTEYCITNNQNVILCSPRRILLENKACQHVLEEGVVYFRNDVESSVFFDKDLESPKQQRVTRKQGIILPKDETNLQEEAESLREFLQMIQIFKSRVQNIVDRKIPCKILVTYDSFRHVKEALTELGIFDQFFVVVDEFQSIFTDAKFKSDTEIELLNNLRGVQKLCFVSATPMMDKYLEMLDEFKDLPYYEFDWGAEEPGRIISPNIAIKSCRSIPYEISRVIKSYQNGDFEKYVYFDEASGLYKEIESREAVIYVNSVANICSIIQCNELTPENTNVLCSRSPQNERKIRNAFKKSCGRDDVGIGSVPVKGEPHKMFTLCTRTVYLGADFYSTNARSFVFSDANVDCLSVDITLDLPQILGRQRLVENPWKNYIELYYKDIKDINKMTKEKFDAMVEEKKRKTLSLLDTYQLQNSPKSRHDLAEVYEKSAKFSNYADDYLSVNRHGGSDLIPVFNNLILISEIRTFEIQQVEYRNRATVFASIPQDLRIENGVIEQKVAEFESLLYFVDKMKYVCNTGLDDVAQSRFLKQIPIIFECYYTVLGPERLKSLSYRNDPIKKEYETILHNQYINVSDLVHDAFKVGERYPMSDIKQSLREIYDKAGLKKTSKATDLLEFFDVKTCNIFDEGSNKYGKGFEILSIKQ